MASVRERDMAPSEAEASRQFMHRMRRAHRLIQQAGGLEPTIVPPTPSAVWQDDGLCHMSFAMPRAFAMLQYLEHPLPCEVPQVRLEITLLGEEGEGDR